MDPDLPRRFPSHPPSGALRSPFAAEDDIRPFPSSSGLNRNDGQTADDAVRATDGDASLSRLSAVKQGYLADPYAEKLIRGRPSKQAYLRPPLINLGTHARSWAMDQLVERFLADVVGRDGEAQSGQVVSLGAGSDTRFWRLQDRPELKEKLAKYVELDFAEITGQKAGFIARAPALSAPLQPYTLSQGNTCLSSSVYHLIPTDLRGPNSLSTALGTLLDPTFPTLWIAECLLVYLPSEVSEGIVRWFTDWSGGRAWVGGGVYEMFGFDDPFGKRMYQNLTARNIPLPSSSLYPTLASQPSRFLKNGYTQAGALSINDIRARLPPAESTRVRALEMLDEVEEMELLFDHYGVSWGARERTGGRKEERWGLR